MALNLNHIKIDLNLPAVCIIDTALGPVIRCWVPYMGWFYAKINPEYKETSVTNPLVTPKYIPAGPCDPSPLLTLIDVLY